MKYIGYKEYDNNLTNTLMFNKLRNSIQKEEGKINREVDEYKKLVKCLVDFDLLYCLADNDQIDEKTKSGVPMLIHRQDFGACIYIFTLFNYCQKYEKGCNNQFSYVRLTKVTEHAGIYNSTFQIAQLMGVKYIVVNAGAEEIIIPITDLIDIGGLGNEVSMLKSELDVKGLLSGDNLNPVFNKTKCAKNFADTIMYRFHTTWRMHYGIILDIVNNAISRSFKWCCLGKRSIAGSNIQWVIDDVPENFNIYDSELKEETGCVVVYGYNGIMDVVMQMEFYNQLKIVDLTILNAEPVIYNNYEFDERIYETFMDSVEMLGYMAETRRHGMSLYKNYIQSQQGICELTEWNAKSISEGIFAAHNFVPDLDKRDNGEPLPKKEILKNTVSEEFQTIKNIL